MAKTEHPRRAGRYQGTRLLVWVVSVAMFIVAGYTSGGAPYGTFADEMPPYDDPL